MAPPMKQSEGPTSKPGPEVPVAQPTTPVSAALKINPGVKRLYYVGLLESAPFEAVDVPTVIIPTGKKMGNREGIIRGKCVSVPKRTGRLVEDGKGNYNHIEGARIGRFEELYDIEYKEFINYCKTHVFRKTAEYQVPIPNEPTKFETHWRAEIEPLDPTGGLPRSLHDTVQIQAETIDKYVWILAVPNTRHDLGQQPTIFEVEERARLEAEAKNK